MNTNAPQHLVGKDFDQPTTPLDNPTLYNNEVDDKPKRKPGRPKKIKPVDNPVNSGDNLKTADVKTVAQQQKMPRYDETSQPNPQKCRFSPYSYHRFARSHKEKMRDGSVIMVLRCRYCIELQQVILRWTLRDGQYVATKETRPVEEA